LCWSWWWGCIGLGTNPSYCLELNVDWHGPYNYMTIHHEMSHSPTLKKFVGKLDETTSSQRNDHSCEWCWGSWNLYINIWHNLKITAMGALARF
jgi:hypothetical protein